MGTSGAVKCCRMGCARAELYGSGYCGYACWLMHVRAMWCYERIVQGALAYVQGASNVRA